jgi:hypothetical protein
MIESLFMVNNSNSNGNSALAAKDNARSQITNAAPMPPENRVLDPKKSQNIAILLRALNVTIDEVCESLREGYTESLCIFSYMDTAISIMYVYTYLCYCLWFRICLTCKV